MAWLAHGSGVGVRIRSGDCSSDRYRRPFGRRRSPHSSVGLEETPASLPSQTHTDRWIHVADAAARRPTAVGPRGGSFMNNVTPAGWFPDPHVPGQVRYW